MMSQPNACKSRPWRRSVPWTLSSCFVLGLMVGLSGCAKPWRPTLEMVRRDHLPGLFDLGQYASDASGWQWTYSRVHEEEPASRFTRRYADGVYEDGRLLGRPFQPLADYLMPVLEPAAGTLTQGRDAGGTQRRFLPPLNGEQGLIFVFDPPVQPLPATARMGEPWTTTSKLVCYDERGRHRYDGDLSRSVEVEGLEDVRIDQTVYAACLRILIVTRFHLYWGPTIELTEYRWLSQGLGEVQRIERVAAWFILLVVEATERYELVSHQAPPTATAPASTSTPTSHAHSPHAFRRWARMAVEITETLPSPRLGGMRIELVEAEG